MPTDTGVLTAVLHHPDVVVMKLKRLWIFLLDLQKQSLILIVWVLIVLHEYWQTSNWGIKVLMMLMLVLGRFLWMKTYIIPDSIFTLLSFTLLREWCLLECCIAKSLWTLHTYYIFHKGGKTRKAMMKLIKKVHIQEITDELPKMNILTLVLIRYIPGAWAIKQLWYISSGMSLGRIMAATLLSDQTVVALLLLRESFEQATNLAMFLDNSILRIKHETQAVETTSQIRGMILFGIFILHIISSMYVTGMIAKLKLENAREMGREEAPSLQATAERRGSKSHHRSTYMEA